MYQRKWISTLTSQLLFSLSLSFLALHLLFLCLPSRVKRQKGTMCSMLVPLTQPSEPYSPKEKGNKKEVTQQKCQSIFTPLTSVSLSLCVCLWLGSWGGNIDQSVCCLLQPEMLTYSWNLVANLDRFQMVNPINWINISPCPRLYLMIWYSAF